MSAQLNPKLPVQENAVRPLRPPGIANWQLVVVIESFMLLALGPALLTQYGGLGWLGILLGVVLAGVAYTLSVGNRLGYYALVILQVLASISLLVGLGVFLTTQNLITGLVFLALLYIILSARWQGDRRTATTLSIVAVVFFVVLFAASSKTQADQLELGVLFFVIYLLLSGAASFLFGVRFADLHRHDILAYFGFDATPGLVLTVEQSQARLKKALSLLYTGVTLPLRRRAPRSQESGSIATRLMRLVPKPLRRTTSIVTVFLLLLAFPFIVAWLEQVTSLSLLISVNTALLFVVLALGLNIVVGFAGLLDLGYAAFFAIGAYTVGVFTWPNLGMEWSFWVVIFISVVMAALFGVIIGAPTLRLRGDYLAIVTLAFGEIVPRLIRELWEIKIKIPFTEIYLIGTELKGFNLTNGPQGMNPVGRPFIFGHEVGVDTLTLFNSIVVKPPMQWYYLIAIAGIIVLVGALRLENSRMGRAWMAIREDETAADAMGVNLIRTKLLAFALGASFSGLAGSIYAAMIQAIFPELFSFLVSIFLLIIVIVSGMGNIWGVLMGGLIITLFDRVILAQVVPQFVPGGDVLQKWRWVMYAAGLIAVMVMRPEGIFPSAARKAELHGDDDDDFFFGEMDEIEEARVQIAGEVS
ncbi:MAG: branched-chain amino acid ABC transporter permease [Caldilineaceae bacterium]|nr:branched-chain amino acid ABC transporter permease [Caldilineaceae bacterium]MBP8106862.1 branched-chain amino acid ABC transporter permease [Caldilineaceae bacterium]MBP8122448.1 branched-chain amino acid ABC transporter permease [Caldilineaceae bacterium]MBP9072230.1 branched-chain amino acid ABC transporter permease [Caldilineaceae bacterium]